MKKSISQRDIAQMLGINVSTVSRALKGLPGVSQDLRRKIEQIAESHSYRPNPFAMSLRYNTTRMIGIVVPDMSFNHYAHIVKWIVTEAREKGYMCVVTDSGDKYSSEVDCVEHLLNMHVEGVVMCLSQETTDLSHLERLKRHHIPVVLFDRVADADYSTVSTNDVELTRQAVRHLVHDGHRRIAFLGGPNQMKQTADRKHGYLKALRESNMPIMKELVKCDDISFNSGLSNMLEFLSLPNPPDAILVGNGLLSIAAFQAIIGKGLTIPDDIAIIGFMSDWVSGMTFPRMTFVKQNLKEIGCKAFQLLSEQMNGNESVKHIVVNSQLNIRDSTRNHPI